MIVVDCSIFIATTLSDEDLDFSNRILKDLENSVLEAVVPSTFYLEISNTLLYAYRRNRIDKATYENFIEILIEYPMKIDSSIFEPHKIINLSNLCMKNDLGIYEACYLEIARRRNIPLATLNKQLRQAAKSLGVLCKL